MASVRAGLILLMMVCFVEVSAQQERVLPRRGGSSLEGTTFVLGFMQNEILEAGIDSKLSLFISSEYAATVTIDFPDGARVVETLVAHSVRTVPIAIYYEVNPSEMVQRKAIFVTSNYPVIVYAMSTKVASTDSYTAIPIPYLGTDYFSVNRPNDYYEPGRVPIVDLTPRGGQFQIIATQDATTVTVTPACATEGGRAPGAAFTFNLNKGDCYLVRAAAGVLGSNDLTGSRIQTTKPVALLSGHVRSSIPTRQESSKDHLIEMLPSADHWGSEYVTTPLALVEGGDYVRMVAKEDNTTIEVVDNSGTRTVNLATAGSWAEHYVTEQTYWKSTKKFLLVQFMPSSMNNPNAIVGYEDYDPAMVVVPALSQYVMGALFQFPILENQNGPQVRYYYINLVADSVALPSLKINGNLITTLAPEITTSYILGTSLRWAQVRLNSGVYSISCDTGTFSGVMYGTSNYDSYANLFGLRWGPLPKLDVSPPIYDLSVDCGHVTGTITDVSNDTAMIDEIIVQTPPTKNYTHYFSPPIDSLGTTTVDATVRDMWKDALLVFHAYDTQGNGREWTYAYDAPDIRVPGSLSISTQGASKVCVDEWIVNRDTTPVSIKRISLQGDPRYTLESLPGQDTLLASGDSVRIRVCFTPSTDPVERTATIVIELPCSLKKVIIVRSVTYLSLRAGWIDFGAVRVGDTACGRVPIINEGETSILVTALDLNNVFPQFTPDMASMGLPKLLVSGDTLWVDVCFVPDTVGAFIREDSVFTQQKVTSTVAYRGRGIQPEVNDVVIDWGKRRIGTRHDSSFVLNNVGEAACILDRLVIVGDVVAFDVGTFGTTPISLATSGTFQSNVSFSPSTEAPLTVSIPLVVDWRYHDTVRIHLVGEGTVPAVETFDIDMGRVIVGGRRDSVVNLVRSYGSERLTVTNVLAEGADLGAFGLPAALSDLQGMPTPSMLTDAIAFLPQHVGYHEVRVAIEHDAMPGTAKDTSFITLHGIGFVPDTSEFVTDLIVESVLDVCVDTSATIRLENLGNTDFIINSVELFANGALIFADTTAPFLMSGHTVRNVSARFVPDRSWDGLVQSVVRYGDSGRFTDEKSFSLRISEMIITSTPLIPVAPGLPITIETHVRSTQTQDLEVSLSGEYTVPADRLLLNTGGTYSATVNDALGAGRTVPLEVIRGNGDNYRWTLGGPVLSPFHIFWSVTANSLWKDALGFDVLCNVAPTPCADGNTARTAVTNELCAGFIRSVRFASIPTASISVAPNPVFEEFDIEAIASEDTEISLYLMTSTGERHVLAERILLIKGSQHVKFSRSQWASGLYWLVMQHGNVEAGLPVMLVY